MTRTSRPILAAAIGVMLLSSAVGTFSNSTSTAAWTDRARFTASATTGKWKTEPPSDPQHPSEVVVAAGNTNTKLLSTGWKVFGPKNNNSFCATMSITGAQSEPQPWELRADMTKPPFNGMSGTSDVMYGLWVDGTQYGGRVQVGFSNPAGDSRTLMIRGVTAGDPKSPWDPDWNNALLTDQRNLEVVVCVSGAPTPAAGDPSWYKVSQSASGTWTGTRACVRLQVAGRVADEKANPFYFGWSGQLDLTAAKAHIRDAGHTVRNDLEWDPWPSGGYQFSTTPETFNPLADSYRIDSGRMTAIRGTETTSIQACLIGD